MIPALWPRSRRFTSGHLAAAKLLLTRGAEINWIGWDGLTPLDAAQCSKAEGVVAWLKEHDARKAHQR